MMQAKPTGWKSYVRTVGDPKFYTNACVYATEKEAKEAGAELADRWFAVEDNEARPEFEEPVNYMFNFETYRSVSLKS